MFVIVNNVGMNYLIKVYVTKDRYGIQVIASVNAINHVMLVEYLDYQNCKCKKKLVDKLIEECNENIEEVKLAKITSTENENKHKCCSYTLYIVLCSVICTINIGSGSYLVCFYWYLKKMLFV